MDVTVADRKRRLPQWMMGTSVVDSVRKSEKKDLNNDDTGDRIISQHAKPKPKSRAAVRRKEVQLLDEDVLELEESNTSIECKAKRKKGKSSQQDLDSNGDACKTGFNKQKPRAAGSRACKGPRKGGRVKSYEPEHREENDFTSLSEEDEDLTMDDLISIAQEYVVNDMGLRQSQPAASDVPHNSEGSSASCHNSAHNSEGEVVVINPSMTGDPAKDMLDLFLGPLLNKPHEMEKKVDLHTEDMTLALEFKKPNRNAPCGEDPVPLTKKKSSLKDRVALFLD